MAFGESRRWVGPALVALVGAWAVGMLCCAWLRGAPPGPWAWVQFALALAQFVALPRDAGKPWRVAAVLNIAFSGWALTLHRSGGDLVAALRAAVAMEEATAWSVLAAAPLLATAGFLGWRFYQQVGVWDAKWAEAKRQVGPKPFRPDARHAKPNPANGDVVVGYQRGRPVVLLGPDRRLHTLLLGPTGGGKSAGVILPLIE